VKKRAIINPEDSMQLFAEALLNEAEGSRFISIRSENCFEIFRFCLNLHPEHRDLVLRIQRMITQACDIYVLRAVKDPPVSQTVHLVEQFKQEAEQLHDNALVHHNLVWSYFVVAAESSTRDHRQFFSEKLHALHRLTGFESSMKALQLLQRIWEVQSTTRWTSLLGGPGQMFIM
jgi:hypothetical protein